MALESGTYIDSLNASNPASTDGLGQADDHLRLIKSTVKATFPNVTGEVTSDHQELSLLDGSTTAVSTAVDATDQVILNDAGTMKQVTVSDLATAVSAASGGSSSGTVTSVAMSVPTGFQISGSPITTSGTLTLAFAGGYMLPQTADITDWNEAYSWGNHANAGYLTSAPAPTTAQVGSATAGLSVDAVGSYAFLKNGVGSTTVVAGSNYAGTNLGYSNAPENYSSSFKVTSSGTWKAMGRGTTSTTTLYLRIA